jgi:N-acetylglucosamine kinase-like BadF-type ATPase
VRIRLASETGEALADKQGAASADLGPEKLAQLLSGVEPSTGEVRVVCAGIAGISRKGMQERWTKELSQLFPNALLKLVPDYLIAFHGALTGPGILVIAGTGSVIYGEHEGKNCQIGGRGWEWGDWGSGAWITAEMLRLTLKALDGLEERTKLVDAICSALDTEEPRELGVRARNKCESEGRGFLVPLALKSATNGDDQAVGLISDAAHWLAKQAEAAAKRLAFSKDDDFPVATVGGLWECGQVMIQPFSNYLQKRHPRSSVVSPTAAPIEGAISQALAALKQAGQIRQST